MKDKKWDWEKCYRALKQFHDKHGHLRISPAVPDYRILKKWILQQRTSHTSLKQEQIKKLLGLGFDFGSLDTRWYYQFFELRDYVREHGCFPTHESRLLNWTDWAYCQRSRRRKGTLPAYRIAWLNSVNIEWDRKQKSANQWEKRFRELQEFVRRHKRLPISHCAGEEKRLNIWVCTQRRKDTILSPQQIKRLKKLGVRWAPERKQIDFNQRMEALKAYARQGHCGSLSSTSSLSGWLCSVRSGNQQLSEEQYRQLNGLNFDWKLPLWEIKPRKKWEDYYAELVSYIQKYNGFPPAPKGPRQLIDWMLFQRKHKTTLTAKQRQKLDALGFVWNPKDEQWNQRYLELCKFRKRFGHCDIPSTDRKLQGIYVWLRNQKSRRSQLSASHRRKLEALGVDWKMECHLSMQQRLKQIERFFSRHGHCNVKYSDDEALAKWMSRIRLSKEQLPADVIRRLKAIGMNWERWGDRVYQELFDERLKELAAFRKKHGHCQVPKRIDKRLNLWVQMQAKLHFMGKLLAERKRRLDKLGFEWGDWREADWQKNYRKLVAYRNKFGHSQVLKAQDKGLARWVFKQRYRKSHLSAERIRQLNKIGFCWALRSSR